ncbi:MAG: radical SAM protein [Microgenomates group bacterium]
MKIAFVNPPFLPGFSRGQRSPGVPVGKTLYYPYWLALACGWAQKWGNEVWLFDFVAKKMNFSQAIKKLKRFSPQLVVIETSTPSINNDLRFAEKVKKNLDCFVLLVGPHVSALPKETLTSASLVDGVAVGEYDQTVVELAEVLEKGKPLKKVAGLVYRQGKKIIVNSPRPLLTNLDDFPFVSQIYKQFLDPRDYFFAAARYPMVMIITGRGCPYGCFYCLWPQTLHGLKYRFRSPEKVVEEFFWIAKNLPQVKEVVIEDDTFTANIPRVRRICQLLIKKGNKLPWSTNTRVHLDLETMKLMKKAGCRLLIVGYESGNQEILNKMNKKITLEQSLNFAQNAKKAGLLVHGCFIIGGPGETLKTAEQTFQFACKLSPDSAQFYPLFVYPGTKAYYWAEKMGYLREKNFRRWLGKKGEYQATVNLPTFSAKEVEKFCRQAYFRFYFRPKYLIKKLIQLVTNPAEGKRSLLGAINFFQNLK